MTEWTYLKKGDNSAPVEAAAEIERLRAALRGIAEVGYVSLKDAPAMHDEAIKIARAALGEKENPDDE